MESRVSKEKIDISNYLSEAVFSLIISWLPVKEAVRTSVLIKRWKDAWKYVTHLDLDPSSIRIPNVEIAINNSQNGNECTASRRSRHKRLRADLIRCTSLFTSIIQSIQNEVTHCRIVHLPVNIWHGELEEWLRELVRGRNVKTLFLKCLVENNIDSRILVLPPGIFSALERLELAYYSLSNTSPFQSCEKLRILKLSSLTLDDGSLAEIFSFCNNIEELRLLNCVGFKKLEISSRNLKLLELRCLSSIYNINISAEALTTLILDRISCVRSCVVINAPRVTEFQAYCSVDGHMQRQLRMKYLRPEELLERSSGFLSCHESSHPLYSSGVGYVSRFKNLHVLCTALDLNDIRHAILLSYIFRVCFRLEKLDITVEDRYPCSFGELYYPEHLFWEKKEAFDSISNCLEVVLIKKFRGRVLEMEFVKYLITKAPRMRRIIVKCADDCITKEVTATLSLLSLPRASMDVSVVIEPPREQVSQDCLDVGVAEKIW